AEVEIEDEDPRKVRQGFPDLVMVWRDANDESQGVVITVEAQNDPDEHKRWRIPVFQAVLADEHRLPTWAVVVSFNERMSQMLRAWSVGPPPKVDVLLVDVETVPK